MSQIDVPLSLSGFGQTLRADSLATALDLYHLLTVSEIVTRTALERKESRGAHLRDDFPEKDNHFGAFNIVVAKKRRRCNAVRT